MVLRRCGGSSSHRDRALFMPVLKESTGGAGPEPYGSRACPGLGEILAVLCQAGAHRVPKLLSDVNLDRRVSFSYFLVWGSPCLLIGLDSFSNRFMLVKHKTHKISQEQAMPEWKNKFFCLFFETQAEGPTG